MTDEIRIERLRVEISEKVASEVHDVIRRSNVETGGVLLGDVFFQEKQQGRLGAFVRVEAYLPARHIEIVHTSLKFSDATWEEWERMRVAFRGLQIVGWVHSHPGCGVFFSGQDLINQQQYFPRPWQIGWVIDHQTNVQGVYRWKNGTMVETEDWQLIRVIPHSTAKAEPSVVASNFSLPTTGNDPIIRFRGNNGQGWSPLTQPENVPVNVIEDVEAWSPARAPTNKLDDKMKRTPVNAKEIRMKYSTSEPPWKRLGKAVVLGLVIFLGAALTTVGVYALMQKGKPTDATGPTPPSANSPAKGTTPATSTNVNGASPTSASSEQGKPGDAASNAASPAAPSSTGNTTNKPASTTPTTTTPTTPTTPKPSNNQSNNTSTNKTNTQSAPQSTANPGTSAGRQN